MKKNNFIFFSFLFCLLLFLFCYQNPIQAETPPPNIGIGDLQLSDNHEAILAQNHSLEYLPEKNNPISEASLNSAFQAYLKKDYVLAKNFFEDYFKSHDGAYARSMYALTLIQLKDNLSALTEIQKAREQNAHEVDYIIIQVEVMKVLNRKSEALSFLEEFKYKLSHNPSIHYHLAELYLETSQFQLAHTHFLQTLFYIENTNKNTHKYKNICLWRLVQIHFAKKDYKGSERYLKEYVSLNKENSYARYILADYVYFQNGKYEEALEELEILLEATPETFMVGTEKQYQSISRRVESLLLQLYSYFKNPSLYVFSNYISEISTAESFLIKVTFDLNQEEILYLSKKIKELSKYDSSSYILWVGLTRAYEKMSNKNQAYTQIYIQHLIISSQLALQLNRFYDGIEALDKILALAKKKPTLINSEQYKQILILVSSNYRHHHQYARATLYLKQAMDVKLIDDKKSNDAKESIFNYIALIAKINPTRALEAIKKLIPKGYLPAKIYSLQASIYIANENWNLALASLDRVIKIEKNPEDYYYRAIVKLKLKQIDQALEDLEELKNFESYKSLYKNLKAYSMALGSKDLDEALALQLSLLEIQAIYSAFQDTLGFIYYKLKDFDKAIYHLEFALNLSKHEASIVKSTISQKDNSRTPSPYLAEEGIEILEHLGDTYLAMNERDKAKNSFEEALRIFTIGHAKALGKKKNLQTKVRLENKILKL